MRKTVSVFLLISLMTLLLMGCGKTKDISSANDDSLTSNEEVVTSTEDEEIVAGVVASQTDDSLKVDELNKDDSDKETSVESKSDSSVEKKDETSAPKEEKKEVSKDAKADAKASSSTVVSETKKEDNKPASATNAGEFKKEEQKGSNTTPSVSETPKTSSDSTKKEENTPSKNEEKIPDHKHEYTPGLGRYAMRQKDGEPCAIEAQTWNTCSICGEEYVQVPWGLYTYEHTIETTLKDTVLLGYTSDPSGQTLRRVEYIYSNICSVCGHDNGDHLSCEYIPCSREEALEYLLALYPPSPDEEEPVEEPPVWEEITEEEP